MVSTGTTPTSYYDVLGVSKTSSKDEIRRAYRKLSLKFHPDRNVGDQTAERKFKEVQEAWDVLSDDEKRGQYDSFGRVFGKGERQPGSRPFRGQSNTGTWSSGDAGPEFAPEELFGSMGGTAASGSFGSDEFWSRFSGSRIYPRKGTDLRAETQVPFRIAIEGGSHNIHLNRGTSSETLTIRIPPGIEDGNTIRLRGKGGAGQNGAPAGDLLVVVHVAPHPWFRRQHDDLLIEVPLTPSEAALGKRIDIPTLSEGPLTVTIPPGTSSGQKLRLRGHGAVNRKSQQRGNLIVEVRIVVPRDLSADHRRAYRELARYETNPRTSLW